MITIFILNVDPSSTSAQPVHWIPATTCAPWTGRWLHTCVVFNDKIWIMGGITGENNAPVSNMPLSDVWNSPNGMDWIAIDNVSWGPRYGHVSVVFNNKIWVMGGIMTMGGFENWAYKNDVWYSPNGTDWTRATANAGWSPRSAPTALVFNNKMWILGGLDADNYKSDVWYSSNGTTWTKATSWARWSARVLHASVVFDNKMWILGGRDGGDPFTPAAEKDRKNDVWFSTDGANWSLATSHANWSARTHLVSVDFDGKMWVIGGYPGYAPETDVWYSSNGEDWTASSWGSAWPPRIGHRSVTFENKMWVIGGAIQASYYNDVWFSAPGAVPEIVPAEDPAEIILPLMGIGFSMLFMGLGYGLTKGKNFLSALVFLNIGFLACWFLGILPLAMVIIGFLTIILYILYERETGGTIQ